MSIESRLKELECRVQQIETKLSRVTDPTAFKHAVSEIVTELEAEAWAPHVRNISRDHPPTG